MSYKPEVKFCFKLHHLKKNSASHHSSKYLGREGRWKVILWYSHRFLLGEVWASLEQDQVNYYLRKNMSNSRVFFNYLFVTNVAFKKVFLLQIHLRLIWCHRLKYLKSSGKYWILIFTLFVCVLFFMISFVTLNIIRWSKLE